MRIFALKPYKKCGDILALDNKIETIVSCDFEILIVEYEPQKNLRQVGKTNDVTS